jgi:hypothetical protein
MGPGTELKAIFAELGIYPRRACDCNRRAEEMDRLGVEGCRAGREEILGWLRHQQAARSWADKIAHAFTAGTALVRGRTSWLRLDDVAGSLLDEALRRAEAKEKVVKENP